jgi:hypothetical protein
MVRGMRVAVVQPQEKIPVSILFEPWEYSAVDLLGRGIETAVVRKVSKILFKTTIQPISGFEHAHGDEGGGLVPPLPKNLDHRRRPGLLL